MIMRCSSSSDMAKTEKKIYLGISQAQRKDHNWHKTIFSEEILLSFGHDAPSANVELHRYSKTNNT